MPRRNVSLLFVLALAVAGSPLAAAPAEAMPDSALIAQVEALIDSGDHDALQRLGPRVLPVMAELYRAGGEERKVAIAGAWYRLGWRSPRAKEVLLADVHTESEVLRINVQYALGRVSADPD